MEKWKIHTIFQHELGTIAVEIVRNVNHILGENSTNKVTVGCWFTKYTKGKI